MKLTGTIKKGKRVYDQPAAPVIAAQDIGEGNRFVETIERWRPTRSDRANARYWAVLVPLAQHLNFLMEQAVIYIYIGEEEEARDLNTRAKIDAAIEAQERDLS